jgi:type I restriction enzyme S subunit
MKEDWIECTFDDLLDYEQPTKYLVRSTKYSDEYKTPVLTAGKSFIKGYTNEKDGVFCKLPTIIFDDFTTATQFVDFPFKVKSSAMKILVPTGKLINMKFIFNCIQVNQVRNDTHKRYWISVYANKKILLPPLAEQRAILEKIEALFSDLDNGIANFKKAQEQLKIYRQAVLKKAFEGELTKEWREKQTHLPTAGELLKQIKEERQNHYNQQIEDWKKTVKEWEKNGKLYDKPRKPTMAKEFPPPNKSEINELPKDWMWVNWNDILDYNDGAFKRGPFGSSLTKSIFVNSGYKVYEQYCPINDDCSFERYYITTEKFKELISFSVKQGDFLISCSGVTLGRITQVPEKFKEGVINQALLRLRLNKDFIDDDFFKFYFRSPFFQKQIFDNSTGSAIPNIKGVNELKAIPVPLLTKVEQKQIIHEIEFRLSVCDKMEQSITESIEKAEALRQSILKKAFEGKLLSEAEIAQCKQAADYEPASELLKKIKAEKLAKEQERKKSTNKKKRKQ